jgi:sugar transferase EpsL
MKYDSLKRVLDFCLASIMLVLLSPLFVALALIVRLKLGKPVLFRQTRPGKGGLPFVLLKFRTMRDAVDSGSAGFSDEKRLTGLGRVLRSTSLDELPELVNVWRGEMSFVGPRPLLMEYLSLYNSEQARRHEVLPGITGLAQIRGRNGLQWPERFALDVWYVDNRSLTLDLKILRETVRTVLIREGINEPGHATMSPFRGN